MTSYHMVLHGLAVKKHGTAEEVAQLLCMPVEVVQRHCGKAVELGRVIAAGDKFMLAPLTHVALAGEYSRLYDAVRANEDFYAALEAFERVNVTLKGLITDWQTMEVGGQRVPNDHSARAYDLGIIDRLGALHETADPIFKRLAAIVPRLAYYSAALLSALEKAEEGDIAWVSDVRIDSYHTVWFELHEDLLRIAGRTRVD